MRASTASLLTLLALPVCVAAGEAPASLDGVPSYKLLRPGLAVGGVPAAAARSEIAKGFRTVIDLRTDQEEGLAEERAALAAAGLRYVSVPFTPDSFSSADVDRVAAVLNDAQAAPVLLHCHSSNRVGGVMAVLAHREGRTLDEALAVGREAGLRSDSMVAAVKRVVASEARPAPGP